MSLEEIQEAVIDGKLDTVASLVQSELDAGTAAEVILKDGFMPAMKEVGDQFQRGDIYTPEMLLSAKTMKAGVAVLKPLLVNAGIQAAGHVVIGTVKGDIHDIGKNLVAMMLEGAGFEIVDLGVDVPPEKFVQGVKANTDLVAMSALLTTTMGAMKETIKALTVAGVRDRVKVLVGGAPITQAYADQIKADGYAADAGSAVKVAKDLISPA